MVFTMIYAWLMLRHGINNGMTLAAENWMTNAAPQSRVRCRHPHRCHQRLDTEGESAADLKATSTPVSAMDDSDSDSDDEGSAATACVLPCQAMTTEWYQYAATHDIFEVRVAMLMLVACATMPSLVLTLGVCLVANMTILRAPTAFVWLCVDFCALFAYQALRIGSEFLWPACARMRMPRFVRRMMRWTLLNCQGAPHVVFPTDAVAPAPDPTHTHEMVSAYMHK